MKNFSELDIKDNEGNELNIEDTLTQENNLFFDNGISTLPGNGEKLLLRLALTQLTDQQKQVIQAIYFKGKTQEETGQELNISRQAVNLHVNSALKKLRKICLGNISDRG